MCLLKKFIANSFIHESVCVRTYTHTTMCVKSDTVVLYFGEFSVSIHIYNDHSLLPNLQQVQSTINIDCHLAIECACMVNLQTFFAVSTSKISKSQSDFHPVQSLHLAIWSAFIDRNTTPF